MSKPNFNKNSSAQGTIESMKGTSIAQGTIESPKATSIAQGTIEYLVIIAIVVVISLVVVALLLGIFENNSDVTSTAQSIQTQTLPIALNEVVIGTGFDANGLIVLTNNTGETIKDIRIRIDGKDHNYFNIALSQGNKLTFKLNYLDLPCTIGQEKIIKTITIIYTTKAGLEKIQPVKNISLQCNPNQNPQTTTNPTNERQQGDTTPQGPTDTQGPIIELIYPDGEEFQLGDGQIYFDYNVSDSSGVMDCNLLIDGSSYAYSNEISENNHNYFNYYFSEEADLKEYQATISCKDTLGNINTQNTTFSIIDGEGPIIELIYPDGEEYNLGDEVEFAFVPTDPNGISECRLIIDESIVYTSNPDSGGETYIYYSDFSEAKEYTWQIECTDNSENLGYSSELTFSMIEPVTFENYFWVTSRNNGTIAKINPSNGSSEKTINTGNWPWEVDIDLSGNIWVASQANATVTKVSGETEEILATYSGFYDPRGITVDSSGNIVVCETSANRIKVLNSTTGAVIGTYSTNNFPVGITKDGLGNLWISHAAENSISKVRESDYTTIDSFSSGGTWPTSSGYDPDGFLWVANSDSDTITKIDLTTKEVVKTYSIDDPQTVKVIGDYVLVAAYGDDDSGVYVLNKSFEEITSYSLDSPRGIAIIE